jgi:hypothetical protein
MISRDFQRGELPARTAYDRAAPLVLHLRAIGYLLAPHFKAPAPGEYCIRHVDTGCRVQVNPLPGEARILS